MASTRDIRLPADSILALRRALTRQLGAQATAEALREAGHAAGDALYERLARGAGGSELPDTPRSSFWQRLTDLFRELGWGSVAHEELHPGVGSLLAREWFEVENAQRPACHFTTGVLANLLGHVAGAEVAVLAVPCDDGSAGCCRFLFGGGQALQDVYQRLREGGDVRAAVAALG